MNIAIPRRRNGRRLIALLLAGAIIASACGDSKGSDTAGASSTTLAPSTSLTPTTGGTLTFGTYQEPFGLDPIVSTGGGVTGGNEMGAIYDVIVRYNPETKKYEPHTAESVTANADFTEWTLKLRAGVKFSDGTDYDAEAVRYGIYRHMSGIVAGVPPCEELRACPRTTVATAGVMGATVKTITVVDKLTLKFAMVEPFADFPAVLSTPVGMIPSPTAIKAACPADTTKVPRDCSFNLKPVGAGPFVIDEFKPKESITLKRNPAYWNGPAYLDGIKFVHFNDAGGDKTYDALKTGTVQAAFLRQWPTVSASRADKFGGYSNLLSPGTVITLNNGLSVTCTGGQPPVCAGRPDGAFTPPVATSRLKVRQAFAAALNADELNTRVFDGKGTAGSEFFHKSLALYPGVEGPKYDLAKAKQLVQEAKAEGWDGKIRWACSNNDYGNRFTTAVQAMLTAAGFTVDAKVVENVSVDVITNRDYDSACWGYSPYNDPMGFFQINGNVSSTSASNRAGYKSADMDAGLVAWRRAQNDTERKAAFKLIAEAYNKDVPVYVQGPLEERTAWNQNVQGIAPTVQSIVLFDKAWIKK